MEEDSDLYGDLDPFFPVEPVSSPCEEDDSSQAQIVKELEDTKETNSKLSAQNNALRKNISCLYKTARLELQRKDSVIKSLQERLHTLEVQLHGAQSQGREVNSHLVMLTVPPKLSTSAKCNYIQCEGKTEQEKRRHLYRPEKQSVVCTEQKLGESHRNGTRSESQRNGIRSQLVRSEGLIMVDAVSQDRLEASVNQDPTVVNGTMNGSKSPVCAMGVEVKRSGASVSSQTRSSSLTGSDKENCPIHRDRQSVKEEVRLGRRSQDVWRSRRERSQVDESHSRSRGCPRERGRGRRRESRGSVSVVRGREGTRQSGRSSKRQHSHDKKGRVLKKARMEPAEAVAFDRDRSKRRTLSEVRQLAHMTSSAVEMEGCAEVYDDVSDGDAYQEGSDKDPRREGHGEECISSSIEPSYKEWMQRTSREDLGCESVTTSEHLLSHDVEAISESDSETEPCTPMELTIVVEPESDVSEVTESLKTDLPSDIALLPPPQDRELAMLLPQESIGREAVVDVGALTALDTEPLPLLSPLQETCSGNCVSISNGDEKVLSRKDQSKTGDDGSTAAGTTERTSAFLESLPEIAIPLQSPLPPSQESNSSDDVLMTSLFPAEDIIPLSPLPLSPSPLSQALDSPTGSVIPSAFHSGEHDTSHDCSTDMVPHSDPLLPHCSGSLSPHTSSTTTGAEVTSEDEGELRDRASHSCRSSKEPSPCDSSQLPSAGSEIEEGELISEEEDNASTTTSSTCSKTSASSAPPMQANRSCKPLKTSREIERSCYRNGSSKEPNSQNNYQSSSEKLVIGTLRSHKKGSRRQPAHRSPTCRSHDSEVYKTQTSHDSEGYRAQRSHDPEGYRSRRLSDSDGYRLQRSHNSKGRSHDLEGYRTRKSHDLEEYRTQRSHDLECHRTPIGHRREMLHSSQDRRLPHAKVHNYSPKVLRRH